MDFWWEADWDPEWEQIRLRLCLLIYFVNQIWGWYNWNRAAEDCELMSPILVGRKVTGRSTLPSVIQEAPTEREHSPESESMGWTPWVTNFWHWLPERTKLLNVVAVKKRLRKHSGKEDVTLNWLLHPGRFSDSILDSEFSDPFSPAQKYDKPKCLWSWS